MPFELLSQAFDLGLVFDVGWHAILIAIALVSLIHTMLPRLIWGAGHWFGQRQGVDIEQMAEGRPLLRIRLIGLMGLSGVAGMELVYLYLMGLL